MTTSFKILGFAVCTLLGSLLAGCSTGDDNNAATGGSSGSGGGGNATGGSGGGASAVTKLYTFDTDYEDFAINTTKSSDPMYTNLGSEVPAPTLGWGMKDYDSTAANPGCMVIEAQFSSWNQSVTAEANGPLDAMGGPLDLSNSTLRMQVWLDSGLTPADITDAPGGVVFFVKSGKDYLWGQAPWTNLDKRSQWVPVKFNTAAPDPGSSAGWDPSNPVQIGVQVSSGGGNMHTAAEFGPPLPTKILVDNITVQKN